jgi:hypothetical protein
MARGIVGRLMVAAAAGATLALAGCGRAPSEQREPWRDQAESACLRSGAVKIGPFVEKRPPVSNGACGMQAPLRVTAFQNGEVALQSYATVACPMIPAIEQWLAQVVQPAALATYGVPVVRMRQMGSYACRRMNNGTGTRRRSEHSFGNAVDIAAFTLANGREVVLKTGWRGEASDRDFLRSVFVGACGVFKTVLGPGSDGYHEDHFHFDLARHRSGRTICRPVIKHTPTYAPPGAAPRYTPRPPPAGTDDEPAGDEGWGAPGEIPEARLDPRAGTVAVAAVDGEDAEEVAAAPVAAPPVQPVRRAPQPVAVAAVPQSAAAPPRKGDRLDRAPAQGLALRRPEHVPPPASRPAQPAKPSYALAAPQPAPAPAMRPPAAIPRRGPDAPLPPGWVVGAQPVMRGPAAPEASAYSAPQAGSLGALY